jgi:ankyrin repeat protein
MKHFPLTTIAAVVLVGCGESNNTEPDDPLRDAVKAGNIEAVKQHLAAGADVNAKNQLGRTSLHAAAYRGHTVVVELLVANDADVNALSVNGKTPLDWAETVYESVQPEYKAAYKETAALLPKHGGKTGAELKAEGK